MKMTDCIAFVPCSKIREDGIVAAYMSSSTSALSPPTHHGKVGPMAVKSFKSINDWELAPEHRVPGEYCVWFKPHYKYIVH